MKEERKHRKRKHRHHERRDNSRDDDSRKRERREEKEHEVPFDSMMHAPMIKKPVNYPDAGSVDNKILPETKIEVSPTEKWVQQFFSSIKTPEKVLRSIDTQAILPMSIG